MTNVNGILAVFTEYAVSHGSATVSLSGEECFVMQVTTAPNLGLSFAGRFGLLPTICMCVSISYSIVECLCKLTLQQILELMY